MSARCKRLSPINQLSPEQRKALLERKLKQALPRTEIIRKRPAAVKVSRKLIPKNKHLTDGYIRYLQTAKWDKKRKRVLKRDNYTCRECGATNKTLHVHHLHYRNIFHERMADLITLCKDCHKRIHSK